MAQIWCVVTEQGQMNYLVMRGRIVLGFKALGVQMY